MLEAIRLERRLEFAFEGMHLFDTRSYKTTEKDVTKPVYGAVSYTHLLLTFFHGNTVKTVIHQGSTRAVYL